MPAESSLPDLSRIFAWAMPDDEETRPWRLADADHLTAELAAAGYPRTVEPRSDDSDEELARWTADYARCAWVEYSGFDRHGLAQLTVSLRDNRDPAAHSARILELAELLRAASKPFHWRVTVGPRFGRPERIILAG